MLTIEHTLLFLNVYKHSFYFSTDCFTDKYDHQEIKNLRNDYEHVLTKLI